MPTPVTDSTVITTPADEIDAGPSHLDAAASFFKPAADEPVIDEPIVDEAKPDPKEKKPAPEQVKTPDLLSQVIKTPVKEGEQKPAADAPPALDPLDKGLQAPPENAKSRAGWDELKKRATAEREARIAAEAKVKEFEAKSKSAPVDDATRARLQELETQNKQFSDELKVLNLRAHPEFKAKYLQPQSDAKAALVNIVKGDESDVDVDGLLALAGKGRVFNKAVSDAMDSLTPYAKVEFQSALQRYIAADIGAKQALANADEFAKTAKQNISARSREAFDRVASGFQGHFLPATPDEKAPDAEKQAALEYNAALANVSKVAEKYAFGELNESSAAEIAHKAALYEFTMTKGMERIGQIFNQTVTAKDAEIETLKAQVKALSAAAPQVNGGSGADTGADAPVEETDHLAAARKFFK